MNTSPPSFRKRWSALVVQLPMLAVMACSDATGVDPYVGFYDMTRFAGKDLPAGDGTIFIRSAVMELRAGGRFQIDMDRDYLGEPETVQEIGNYTVSSGFITLHTQPNPLTGAIFPTYIRLNDGDDPSIWVKRE